MLHHGLYEQVINRQMAEELDSIAGARKAVAPIDRAEAPVVLAQYLTGVIRKGLDNIADSGNDLSAQVELTNRIIELIRLVTQEEDFSGLEVTRRAELLLALLKEKDPVLAAGKNAEGLVRPESSVARSSLFTGAPHEPQMYLELKRETASADRIDMLVSFIKWSGLRLIINELREFTLRGGELRVITTSYMGATDMRAVEELCKLPGARVKVSYNTKITRLHAKAYIFHRETGFTTAYVGSSNLSGAALTSGLEWNTKVTGQDLPETIGKIAATFEYYWNDREFEYYSEKQRERLARALHAEKHREAGSADVYTMDIRPYAYQQEILDRLEAERTVHGHDRNLIVAATGTGKTVVAALDYRRFCKKHPDSPCRLLFVAHREEILRQSLYTFRAVLKNANFGELFTGNVNPESIDHLFISVQTVSSRRFCEKTAPDFYDYIVIDEFHHAAAPTYRTLLNHYRPRILVGLTATPERMDGQDVLTWFSHRIAAEIRLPEAIERGLLCPFQYFGVTDSIDLNTLKWSRGGYDKGQLSNIYTFSGVVARKRAALILDSVLKYVTDIADVKGLGFCVSVAHAVFMSDYFNEHGIPSLSLSGASPAEERKNAKDRLVKGEIRLIFVVDLYNEGVDIPEINTVLFLRPTESLTIFLQQLGRGLRLAENKDCLTVLDFIGQAHKKYRFEHKFAALLTRDTPNLDREIKNGFLSVPRGCSIQLEKVAARHILENIRAFRSSRSTMVSRLATFTEDTGLLPTLPNVLEYYHLAPGTFYKYSSFSRLCAEAGIIDNFAEPLETILKKAFARFSAVDSRRWILFLLDMLPRLTDTDIAGLPDMERRMMQMFYVTVWEKTADDWNSPEVRNNLRALANCPVMLAELTELLKYRYAHIDVLDQPLDLGFACPLDVHCTYTRDQLLVAMDFLKPSTVREGVKWLPDKKLDIFLITLNKADKDYSPTTMYKDYSISEDLFHWQSQSTTGENSPTGQRYIHHREMGSRILLFVREYKADPLSGVASAYTFLGTARYVKHEGSKPMSITWMLDVPIPAKFLKKTSIVMAG